MEKNNDDFNVSSILLSLRGVRERFGITQQELSERAGVTQTQVSRMENLSYMPRLDILMKVANCLNVEMKLTSPFSDDYYYSKVKAMTDVHRFYTQKIENFTLTEDSIVTFIKYEDYKMIIAKYDDLFDVVQKITKADENHVLYVMSILIEDYLICRMTGEDWSEEKVERQLEQYSIPEFLVDERAVMLVMGMVRELIEELISYIDDFTLSYSADRVSDYRVAVDTINVLDAEFGEKVMVIDREKMLSNLKGGTEYQAIIEHIETEFLFDIISSQEVYEAHLSEAKRGNVGFIVTNVRINRERAERNSEKFKKQLKKMDIEGD